MTARAHWCNGVDMATATYDSKHGRWDLSWKKPAAQGSKYSYGRKRITDKVYPTLGAREQKRVQREMDAHAAALEQAAQRNAPAESVETPKAAWAELAAIKRVCISTAPKGVKDARNIIIRFVWWLYHNHPGTMLAAIDETIMAEYTAHLMGPQALATNTAKQHIRRIMWVMRKRGHALSCNVKALLGDYVANEEKYERESITPDEFAYIVRDIMGGDTIKDDILAFNSFALMYLGICTSWRRGDLVHKTWADVYITTNPMVRDQEFGTLKNRHHKTRKASGATTTIRLTRTMRAVLDTLREINGDSKTIMVLGKDVERNPQQICDKLFAKMRAHYGKESMQRGTNKVACLSYHSLRTTAISHNIKAGLQESLVSQMAGHAPANVEREHYIKYTPDDFQVAVRNLEQAYIIPLLDGVMSEFKGTPRARVFAKVMEAMRVSDSCIIDYGRFDMDRREVKVALERLRRAGFFQAFGELRGVTYQDVKVVFSHLLA